MIIEPQLTIESEKQKLLKLSSKTILKKWLQREENLKKQFKEIEIKNVKLEIKIQNLEKQNFKEIFIMETINKYKKYRVDVIEIYRENRKLRQNNWQTEHFKNLSEQRYKKIKELEENLKNSNPC